MICSCRNIRNKDYTTHILFSFLNLAFCLLFIWTALHIYPVRVNLKLVTQNTLPHISLVTSGHTKPLCFQPMRKGMEEWKPIIGEGWSWGPGLSDTWDMNTGPERTIHYLLMNDEHNMGQYSSLLTTPTWWMSLELMTTCRALHVTHGAINVCLSWLNKIRVINIPIRVLRYILLFICTDKCVCVLIIKTCLNIISSVHRRKCQKNHQ